MAVIIFVNVIIFYVIIFACYCVIFAYYQFWTLSCSETFYVIIFRRYNFSYNLLLIILVVLYYNYFWILSLMLSVFIIIFPIFIFVENVANSYKSLGHKMISIFLVCSQTVIYRTMHVYITVMKKNSEVTKWSGWIRLAQHLIQIHTMMDQVCVTPPSWIHVWFVLGNTGIH